MDLRIARIEIMSGRLFWLGIYLPWHYYGGITPMFRSVQQMDPQFLTLHTPALGVSWFISTVLLMQIVVPIGQEPDFQRLDQIFDVPIGAAAGPAVPDPAHPRARRLLAALSPCRPGRDR